MEKIILESENLVDCVSLVGFQDNVFNFFKKNLSVFILSSLSKDPGFVILEAGFSNTFVISSDCKNGPQEILENVAKTDFIHLIMPYH